MYFNGREIQSYELELNGTEIELIEIDIQACDVIDAVFDDFDGIESEMVDKYKGSWKQFSGEELKEIHSSLTEYLKCEWEFEPKQEEKPKVKKGYEVGMVLRATVDSPLGIPLEKGALVQIMSIKNTDNVKLEVLWGHVWGCADVSRLSWVLPDFEEKELHGFELVEGTVVLNNVENTSTEELLAEIQNRMNHHRNP